ncbi:TRAM domain-containing protein, partial [Gordonia sp. (in: high G+C Gram-positive bacteria)]|uniref:TRAM domain-containing protein n=1 Tax=Gordonia sp. (in: high G+C Gram-positive bacteria) TaxID=84139 RepID=UPI0039E2A877
MSGPRRLLTCTTTALAHGGAGVARVDGRVVFVTGALPGETVLAEVTDDSRPAFWRARTVEVQSPSPDRVPVSCPAAAAGAGCCDLAYGTVPAIARAKAGILADALERIGGLTPPPALSVDAVAGGESGHRWRIRARLGVDDRGAVGFRAAHSTAIVTEPCAAPTAEMTAAVAALDPRDLTPGAEIAVVHDDDGRVHVVESVTAAPRRGGGGGARAA